MPAPQSGRLRRVVPGGLLAVALGVAASVLVACGQTNGLLSSGDGASLSAQLGQVSDAVAAGRCGAARSAAAKLAGDATRLSPTVNAELRRDLRGGAATVADRVAKDCKAQPTTTETITTDTTTLPPTTTTATPTTTTSTTTPTATTPTTTTPTTPSPPTTPTDTTPLTIPSTPSGGAPPGGTTP